MQVKTEFTTFEYEFSHGQKPRGRGGWAFYPKAVNGPTDLVEGEPVFIHGSTTYTVAKGVIKMMHPEVTWWEVAP